MYGAYHHITVMGKEDTPCDHKYDVTGSLCENNDKFAIDRMLPKIDMGDILVIHDTGAHGFSMGYNYNGKLKSAEVLLKEDGSTQLIRRAETPADYFWLHLIALILGKKVDKRNSFPSVKQNLVINDSIFSDNGKDTITFLEEDKFMRKRGRVGSNADRSNACVVRMWRHDDR